MFGLDPSGTKARRILAQDTLWLCDSNVFMPLLAVDCHLHEFARDLFNRMTSIALKPITTTAFLREVRRAYQWSYRRCVEENPTLSDDMILGVIQHPDYRENLFIDGYINGAARGRWSTFLEYSQALGIDSIHSIEATLSHYGVKRRDLVQFEGYCDNIKDEVGELESEIRIKRKQQGTLRADQQPTAEAEALGIIRGIRSGRLRTGQSSWNNAYFVSTSRLLDALYADTDGLLTWFPENLYRHLSFLSTSDPDPAIVFESIASDYYAMGVEIIDEAAYRKFFNPLIGESRLRFGKEREAYTRALEADVEERQKEAEEFEQRFEETPDLQKPLFVAQMGWHVARKEEELRRAAEELGCPRFLYQGL